MRKALREIVLLPDAYNSLVLDLGTEVAAQSEQCGREMRVTDPVEGKRRALPAGILFLSMATKLEEIVAAARRRIAAAKAAADVRVLKRQAERHQPRGFRHAIQQRAANGVAVIAELKKASPSKGVIREDFRVAELARELERAGAAALSVLTDKEYFQGSLENLASASETTLLPCLRKDFIVDEFQIVEARARGADAILLIVAALEGAELIRLGACARENDLDVLCEVHDAGELHRALTAGFETIGINNRDLNTFQVDLNTSLQLAECIPAGVVKIAESGIESAEDIARLRQAGFDGFLIGEMLMRAASPGDALRALLGPAISAR